MEGGGRGAELLSAILREEEKKGHYLLLSDLQQATSMHVSAKTVKYRLHGCGMKSPIGHLLTVQWHPSVRTSTGTRDSRFLKVW